MLSPLPASAELAALEVSVPEDGTLLVSFGMSVVRAAADGLPGIELSDAPCDTFISNNMAMLAFIGTTARTRTFRVPVTADEHTVRACGSYALADVVVTNVHMTRVFEPGAATNSTLASSPLRHPSKGGFAAYQEPRRA